MTKQELLDEVKLTLLQNGGVDNWDNYYESISNWERDNGCDVESSSDILDALSAGGVDNWTWYSESLDKYFEWKDHVNKFYDTPEFKDYDDWLDSENERIELEEKMLENSCDIIQELCENIFKNDEYDINLIHSLEYQTLVSALKEKFTLKDIVEVYNIVLSLPRFWAGLGTPEGLSIFNEAKTKAIKELKRKSSDGKFNGNEFLELARTIYIEKIVNSNTFKDELNKLIIKNNNGDQ